MSVEKEKDHLVLEEKAQPPAYTPAPPPGYTPAQPTVVYQPVQVDVTPPNDQLVLSLFTTFCCFWPLGVFAIVKSIEARTAYRDGRQEDAAAATRSAKTLNKLAILVGIIVTVTVLILAIVPRVVLAIVT